MNATYIYRERRRKFFLAENVRILTTPLTTTGLLMSLHNTPRSTITPKFGKVFLHLLYLIRFFHTRAPPFVSCCWLSVVILSLLMKFVSSQKKQKQKIQNKQTNSLHSDPARSFFHRTRYV